MASRSTSSRTGGQVCVGVVTGARGLRGQVRIKSFTADPADVAAYGPVHDATGSRTFRLQVTGQVGGRAGGQLVAGIEGVEDRDAAEALKGVELFVSREALPETGEDEFYHADLIGMGVEWAPGAAPPEGASGGKVKAIHDFGAGPILEIEWLPTDGKGKEAVMVPFTAATVPQVDLTRGRIVIDPPPGLFEPPSPEAMDGNGMPGKETRR